MTQAVATTNPSRPAALTAQPASAANATHNLALRADLMLEKIPQDLLQKSAFYQPAQQKLSFLDPPSSDQSKNLSPMRSLLLWSEAGKNVASGNPTQSVIPPFSGADSSAKSPLRAARPSATPVTAQPKAQQSQGSEKAKPYSGCKTCESRTYQDQSSDAGVSFQAPTRVPASTAALSVVSHEGEHATRETARAQENGEVITNKTVTLQMGCCPECHRMYVKGGTTSITKTSAKSPNTAVVQSAANLMGAVGEQVNLEA